MDGKAAYLWDNVRRLSLSQIYWRLRNRTVLQRFVDPWLVRRQVKYAPTSVVPGSGVSEKLFLESVRRHARETAFFASDNAASVRSGRSLAEDEVDRWIALADDVLAGRYPIVGEDCYELGFPPARWDENPSHDFEWQVALFRLRLFAVALAKAHAYTGDRRYSEGCESVVQDWIDRNPMGTPMSTAPMQITVRLHGWFWAFRILLASDALTPEFTIRFISSMTRQTDFLCGRLERDLNENHLLYNYFTLFMASVVLPVPVRASKWRTIGHEGLLTEIRRQFHPDGLHAEQSTGYHVSVTVLLVEWLWLCRNHGIDVPEWATKAVERAIEACLPFWKPGPSLWLMSDAFYSFLSWNLVDDVRTSLIVGADLLGRDDLLGELDRPSEWSCWFLGDRTEPVFDRRPSEPTPVRDGACSAGGYHAVRTGIGEDLESLVFDGGPYALPHVAGHAHSDCLSVVWSIGKQEILTDPGIWVYHPSEESSAFKRTACHNTLMIDEQDHGFLWTFHRWCFLPNVRMHAFERRGDGYFFDGEHDGYRRLEDPVTHRRRMWYIPGEALLIEDEIVGAGRHAVQLGYQFGVGMDVATDGTEIRFSAGPISGTLLVCSAGQGLLPSVEQATVCPDYNVRREAMRAVFKADWSPGGPRIESVFRIAGHENLTVDEIRARVRRSAPQPVTVS